MNKARKISTLAHIFLLNTDKPKKIHTKIKILQDAIKLRKRPVITSRYNNCVLLVLLFPVEIRTFSKQMKTLQRKFISQTCSFPSLLSESNADDRLCLMDLIIIYLNYLSG
jgi:hypothetical protein